MSKINAVITFDEMKPHIAKLLELDDRAQEIGMTDIVLSGDFDAKIANIYGHVTDFAKFRKAQEAHPDLREGTLFRVGNE